MPQLAGQPADHEDHALQEGNRGAELRHADLADSTKACSLMGAMSQPSEIARALFDRLDVVHVPRPLALWPLKGELKVIARLVLIRTAPARSLRAIRCARRRTSS
jgi:hypothetical protein